MITVNRQHRIVPYGVSHWDEKAFSVTAGPGATLRLDCRARCAVIDPAEASPLRLNGGQYEFAEPPNMRLLPTVWDQLAFLENHFLGLCDAWAKHQRRFITRYFDFIRRRVEAERAALSQAIADFGNLYEYRDWAFSALRPLPRAYVFAPRDKDRTALPRADDFVPADIVFWTGRDLLVLDLSDPGAADPFGKRRLERVQNAGIPVLAVAPAVLEGDDDFGFREILPEALQNFWQGELAPSRPFVDTKLGGIAAGDIGF